MDDHKNGVGAFRDQIDGKFMRALIRATKPSRSS